MSFFEIFGMVVTFVDKYFWHIGLVCWVALGLMAWSRSRGQEK